jgi:alkanesulfonate monooxygenase SsuD/methylene tetrahydromethanopterin reductase-like flavin-dependent oxidoreductase (luciferase family)
VAGALGTIDRLVYGNLETVPVLAAAAAVTDRIGLTTAILIGPYRGNGALLAKQLATVDSIAGGRLQLGIAVGGRQDDFEATGSPYHTRGRDFDDQLVQMREVWAQEPRGFAGPIGPAPVQAGGPPMLLGGNADAAFKRMVEFGVGWIQGGGGPAAFASGAERARQAWRDVGRAGEPRLAALSYVSLGPDAQEHAQRYLGDYYGFLGDFASRIAAAALQRQQLGLAQGAEPSRSKRLRLGRVRAGRPQLRPRSRNRCRLHLGLVPRVLGCGQAGSEVSANCLFSQVRPSSLAVERAASTSMSRSWPGGSSPAKVACAAAVCGRAPRAERR